ncbi:prephenate dehydratase domain-containing protein [Desulforhopalus sp. IMCC35007]|uniref:prephenate dehydratase domain-containing protein n=1 Tax=Desulforhopalus sp. IMCC35007 TaxID=2569543 RepID=UPI0010AEC00A|nr:prephenate dehydratase domain-containing protein [Desulforhopalus sp. IMCC35007]TKB11121.1 prephenate dehydrogenase/arogenate dehydrogenase family protein [Desulforhopalus sp. IMCC35007]
MSSIATIGPVGSDSYQACCQYAPEAKISHFTRISEVLDSFTQGKEELALIPVYNTREGEVKEYFRLIAGMENCYWIDNVVLPIHLSLGALENPAKGGAPIHTIVGRSSVFRQCAEYLEEHFPDVILMAVTGIDNAMLSIAKEHKLGVAVIESEELVKKHNLELLDREVVSHNRTRFAILSKTPAKETGYDATAVITKPLKDRVGILADILGEFTRRGINILDLQSENDIKTQKLRIYLEVEGHIANKNIAQAFKTIESNIIQEDRALKILGSFPRVDMRVKKINFFGFIGSGDMSGWFADRLKNEGYKTIITGRSTPTTPAEMIAAVDVVVVCVPISVTASTIAKYGPLMRDGQALIILAGESENTIASALESTSQGVEIMFVHNLWGPQAIAMKDKNATIVRTPRSGSFCSEFEAFLYKHGADIFHDSAQKHDLLMGVGQKLPTTISVALAMTLKDHKIDFRDIGSHSTLTSLYGILAMARVHNQNPRTYAEIMATEGDGRKIVRSFAQNILKLIELAENGKISNLLEIMESNRKDMPQEFLRTRMKQAKAVDQILSQPNLKMS